MVRVMESQYTSNLHNATESWLRVHADQYGEPLYKACQ